MHIRVNNFIFTTNALLIQRERDFPRFFQAKINCERMSQLKKRIIVYEQR